MRIGIIDSGIGGLSTILAIDKLTHFHQYIYFYDKINLPYGEKSVSEMQALTLSNAKFLQNEGVDVLVLACNTAATTSLDFLRENLTIPCFGVTPPLFDPQKSIENFNCDSILPTTALFEPNKSYVYDFSDSFSSTDHPLENENAYFDRLLLCTPLTARRLVLRGAVISNLIISPQKGLATLIENSFPNFDGLRPILTDILQPYKNLNCIILGCTHYSFVEPIISECAPTVKIINGNETVAKAVADFIKSKIELEQNNDKTSKIIVLRNGIDAKEYDDLLLRMQKLSVIPCISK